MICYYRPSDGPMKNRYLFRKERSQVRVLSVLLARFRSSVGRALKRDYSPLVRHELLQRIKSCFEEAYCCSGISAHHAASHPLGLSPLQASHVGPIVVRSPLYTKKHVAHNSSLTDMNPLPWAEWKVLSLVKNPLPCPLARGS